MLEPGNGTMGIEVWNYRVLTQFAGTSKTKSGISCKHGNTRKHGRMELREHGIIRETLEKHVRMELREHGITGKKTPTLDVSVNDARFVQKVDSLHNVSRVVPDHVLVQTLLGYAPYRALVAVLHEHVELTLRGGREGRLMVWTYSSLNYCAKASGISLSKLRTVTTVRGRAGAVYVCVRDC